MNAAQLFSQQSAFAAARAKKQIDGGQDIGNLRSENTLNYETLKDRILSQEDERNICSRERGSLRDHERLEVLQSHSHSYISLSTWTPQDGNILSQSAKSVRIQIDRGQKIAFVGKYDLWVISGIVRVYGARLNQNNVLYRIYAPSTHPLPCIECISQVSAIVEIWNVSSTLSKLSTVAPLYRDIWNARAGSAPSEGALETLRRISFSYLHVSADDAYRRVLYPQVFPFDWQHAFSKITVLPKPTHSSSGNKSGGLDVSDRNNQQRIAVCGRIGSGRMLFAQLLFNYLLTRSTAVQNVYYLDIDPAMPMFSVPGIVYLARIKKPVLGPSFTAMCPPERPRPQADILLSYTFPALTVDENPELACRYVRALLLSYQDHLTQSQGPLVIKCPGWTRTGIGAEIVSEFLTELAAANIFCLATEADHDVVRTAVSNVQEDAQVHILPPYSIPATRSAEDLRKMQYISYFTQDCDSYEVEPKWKPQMLVGTSSVSKLSFDRLDSMLLGVLIIGDIGSGEFVPMVLEGSLVSVVEVCAQETRQVLQLQSYRTADSIPMVPETGLDVLSQASASRLIGHGIVIRVDVRGKYLTLRTPFILANSYVTPENQSTTRQPHLVLVRGKFESPTWADVHTSRQGPPAQQPTDRQHSGPLPADLMINMNGLPADYDGHADEESGTEGLETLTELQVMMEA